MDLTTTPLVRSRTRFAMTLLLVLVSAPRTTVADTNPTGQALAQTLFDRGRELMTAKKYGEACEKFAESERLDPSVGTELNLGLCYESQGRTAAAWAAYRAAGARARRDGRRDREQAARDRAAALEPKLARVSMAVAAGGDVPGMEVRLDGTLLGRATWDVAAPIDPGAHVIEVRAPGYRSWTSRFDVAAPATKQIAIPLLNADASATSTSPSARGATSAVGSAGISFPTAPVVPAPATSFVGPTAPSPPTPPAVPTTASPAPFAPSASAPAGVAPSGTASSSRTWMSGRYWLDNATVEDVKTALTWQRYVIPRGAVWETASAYCGSLRVGGSAGWRLPTSEELASLIVPGRNPAIDPQVFPQTPAGWFWTAEHHPWGVAEAISSTTGAKQPVMSDRPLFVRCVR